MRQSGPPSAKAKSRLPSLYIGRDDCCNWVVQDKDRLCCGLFADRAQALRFAMFENGARPQAAIMVPGVFAPDISGRPGGEHDATGDVAAGRK